MYNVIHWLDIDSLYEWLKVSFNLYKYTLFLCECFSFKLYKYTLFLGECFLFSFSNTLSLCECFSFNLYKYTPSLGKFLKA